jgi:transcriptional regulator with XRE-family HTH domain
MQAFVDEQKRRFEVDSLAQLAKRFGITRETLSRWYNAGQLPTPKTARAVAARLGISPDEIPQFDPRGARRRQNAEVAAEIEALWARIEELGAELRDLRDQLTAPELAQVRASRRRHSHREV